jgi:hypothetical protein
MWPENQYIPALAICGCSNIHVNFRGLQTRWQGLTISSRVGRESGADLFSHLLATNTGEEIESQVPVLTISTIFRLGRLATKTDAEIGPHPVSNDQDG